MKRIASVLPLAAMTHAPGLPAWARGGKIASDLRDKHAHFTGCACSPVAPARRCLC